MALPQKCRIKKYQRYRIGGLVFGRWNTSRWFSCRSLLAATVSGASWVSFWAGPNYGHTTYWFW